MKEAFRESLKRIEIGTTGDKRVKIVFKQDITSGEFARCLKALFGQEFCNCLMVCLDEEHEEAVRE